MKLFRNSIITAAAVLLSLAAATKAHAFDFTDNGIFYHILQNNEVEVTSENNWDFNSYSDEVVIPSTVTYLGTTYKVTTIGVNAFRKCAGLTKVTIPNSVTTIGNYAFEACSWLTSISIPSSVKKIGERVFNNCINLESITVASGNSVYDSRNNCNAIIEKATGKLIAGCSATVIPEGVTEIDDFTFGGCVKLNEINIPNSVVAIDEYAFNQCPTLTNVTLGTGVKDIGTYAFILCNRLNSVTTPASLKNLGTLAFGYCKEIESITLNEGLESIGNSAFYGCENIKSVNIPASTNKIDGYAFSYCKALESIKVASGNSTYDSRKNCNAIVETATDRLVAGCQNTVVPNDIKAFEYGAFQGIDNLKTVTIPAGVKFIKNYAFYDCKGLTDIYSKITQFSELEYNYIFGNVPTATCKLHVPKGTKRVYESMDEWKDFTCVEDAGESGDANVDNDIDVLDVTFLINLIMNGKYDPNADINCDGELDVKDVTKLINRILKGPQDYDAEYGMFLLKKAYQSMHTAGWSTTGNTHQCFGISAYDLVAEVMGDDFVMAAQGSGWFFYDAAYNVKERYTSTAWRSFDLWNAYYTWIGNANQIINYIGTKSTPDSKYILGQAYTMRAYSYFMLAQWFARTYKGHESEPCVPIFNDNVFEAYLSTGQPRATVAQVYAQIDADINKAINLLTGSTQQDPIHMGLGVALGIQSRIALVKEDWNTALTAAKNAITASGKKIADVPSFMGLNNANAQNVMWGATIDADHVGEYASLFTHMDQVFAYGTSAPKQITASLYNKMSATDARRAWWDEDAGSSTSYFGGIQQVKFTFSNPELWLGDYIWMRVEEMYLNAAEAACRMGDETQAKKYLTDLMAKRDPSYTCNKTGVELGTLTTDVTGSLLEEIITQRRIELWGETGRVFDIRRLKQGLKRNSTDGWPSRLLLNNRPASVNPENYMWVLTIPKTEFDSNPYMDLETDQNPLDDE
ncbi:MAG: leucine-rich repeat protein [Muribaculaceae bacterium]|nr:leucine-rich repeat protein [Muribaculaceae bacterium]